MNKILALLTLVLVGGCNAVGVIEDGETWKDKWQEYLDNQSGQNALVKPPAPEIVEPPAGPVPVAQWKLVADKDLALQDQLRGGMVYPNPHGCEEMNIEVINNGELCGTCIKGDSEAGTFCSQSEGGLPYFTFGKSYEGQLYLLVKDMYGRFVHYELVQNTCIQNLIVDGASCVICSNELGELTSDTCGSYVPSIPDELVKVGFFAGAQEFVSQFNSLLRSQQVPTYDLQVQRLNPDWFFTDRQTAGQYDFNYCQNFSSAATAFSQDPQFSWWIGNAFRLALATNYTAGNACGAKPSGCEGECARYYSKGVFAAYQLATMWNNNSRNICLMLLGLDASRCEQNDPDGGVGTPDSSDSISDDSSGECDTCDQLDEAQPDYPDDMPPITGSPLVITFPGEDLELSPAEAGVKFDLLGSGFVVRTGWIKKGALLAIDLNGNNRIDQGGELFGEFTRMSDGSLVENGFEALGQYDHPEMGGNADGRIDGRDEAFHRLRLWSDRNHDGISQPEELETLVVAGLERIFLNHKKCEFPTARAAGNIVGLEGLVQWSHARTSRIYDVWFRYLAIDNEPLMSVLVF